VETSLVDGLLSLSREVTSHPWVTSTTVWKAGHHLAGSNAGRRLSADEVTWDRLLNTLVDLLEVRHTLVVENTSVLLLVRREGLCELFVEALELTDELLALAELLLVATSELGVLVHESVHALENKLTTGGGLQGKACEVGLLTRWVDKELDIWIV